MVAQPRRIATRAAARRLAELWARSPGGASATRCAANGSAVRMRIEVVTTGLLSNGCSEIRNCVGRRRGDRRVSRTAPGRRPLAGVLRRGGPDVARRPGAGGDVGDTRHRFAHPRARRAGDHRDLRGARRPDRGAPPPRPLPLLPGSRVDPRLLHHVADVTRRPSPNRTETCWSSCRGSARSRSSAGPSNRLGVDVRPLFGRQTSAEQDLALTPGPRRRVVVTTSVAESSLTVPGVRAVVDAGLAREPRTDQARGLGALITTRVSKASADQRAGRAGREAPGHAYRCWSADDHVHLAAHALPEIATADLTGFALAAAAWGAPGGKG